MQSPRHPRIVLSLRTGWWTGVWWVKHSWPSIISRRFYNIEWILGFIREKEICIQEHFLSSLLRKTHLLLIPKILISTSQEHRTHSATSGLEWKSVKFPKMAASRNIQELKFKVDVDMQRIYRQVGPLVLSTTKPYRERRNKQPQTIARRINMGQKEIYSDYGDMGILRNIPTEILYMIFESMDVQTFLRMKRVCKSLKVCTSRSRN